MKFLIALIATVVCAGAVPNGYNAYSSAPETYYGGYYGSSYAQYPAADIKVLSSGYIADTPEVAHAKAVHLVEKSKADAYSYSAQAAYAHAPDAYAPYYAGAYAHYPAADIKVLPNGYLADTPEVAQAKAAHHVAKAHVAAAAAANPDYDSYSHSNEHSYSSPAYYSAPAPYVHSTPYSYGTPYYAGSYAHSVADIKVLPNGYLADTPEVAHAKAVHFAEKAKSAAAAAAAPEHGSYSYVPASYAAAPAYASYSSPATYSTQNSAPATYVTPYATALNAYEAPYYAGSYAHSVADIKVLPNGFLADTPEVAHAKAAHFVEKAKSAAAAAASPEHGSYSYAVPAYTTPAYAAPTYSTPTYAAPAYIVDTPEVAHAKAVHSVEQAKAYVAAAANASPAYESYSYAVPAYSAPAYSYSSVSVSHGAQSYSHVPSHYESHY